MSEPATAELPPQTNGVAEPEDDDERGKMRPADIDADMKEMEKRKRVEMIMSSRLFREELERIIESQMKEGGGPAGLLQQIKDMVGGASRLHAGAMFKNSSCVVPINDIRGVESMGYTKGEKLLRCKLAAVFRLMDLYGWTHGIHNNITARLNQEQEHFLVNPFGMMYHELTASSLVKVDMQANVVEQGTTNFGVDASKFQLHGAVHAARPDLKCVIHIHTPSVVAISSLKVGLLPLGREAAVLGEVSQHRFLGCVTEPEEKDKIARSLGPINKVLLLSNAGALCCGETVEEAFFNVYNTVLACETQVKLMPMGIDNLEILPDEARKAMYDAARKAPEGALPKNTTPLPPALEKKEKKWRIGGMEFEALMRMLDNAGFRTGYIYRTPLVKGEPPKPRNDVEVPPAVSSLGYLLEEEEMYKQGQWKKGVYSKNDRTRWLNSPNVYQKVEILETGTTDPKKITKWVDANNPEEWVAEGSPTHTSTPVRIDAALQFVPKNTNPKEFKKLQQQIKENRRADKITSGPQSHILEGVTWEEAKKLQDATISMTGDHVIQIGAASKGIIQRGFQHNATVYKTPYAKNPFDCVSDQELEDYKKVVTRKTKGDYYDEDASESEALSSSAALPPSDIKSPPSETEDDSRTEPRVLRIETKTAPVASQAEVVLSDDPNEEPKLLKLKVRMYSVEQARRLPRKCPSPIKEEPENEAVTVESHSEHCVQIKEPFMENSDKLGEEGLKDGFEVSGVSGGNVPDRRQDLKVRSSGALESTSSEVFHSTHCCGSFVEKIDKSTQTRMRIWIEESDDEAECVVSPIVKRGPPQSYFDKSVERTKMIALHQELTTAFEVCPSAGDTVRPSVLLSSYKRPNSATNQSLAAQYRQTMDDIEEVSVTVYSRSLGEHKIPDYDENRTGFSSDDTSNSGNWSSLDEDDEKEKEDSLQECVGHEYEGAELMTDPTTSDGDLSPLSFELNDTNGSHTYRTKGFVRFLTDATVTTEGTMSSSPYSASPSDQEKLRRDMEYLRRKFVLKASVLKAVSTRDSGETQPLIDSYSETDVPDTTESNPQNSFDLDEDSNSTANSPVPAKVAGERVDNPLDSAEAKDEEDNMGIVLQWDRETKVNTSGMNCRVERLATLCVRAIFEKPFFDIDTSGCETETSSQKVPSSSTGSSGSNGGRYEGGSSEPMLSNVFSDDNVSLLDGQWSSDLSAGVESHPLPIIDSDEVDQSQTIKELRNPSNRRRYKDKSSVPPFANILESTNCVIVNHDSDKVAAHSNLFERPNGIIEGNSKCSSAVLPQPFPDYPDFSVIDRTKARESPCDTSSDSLTMKCAKNNGIATAISSIMSPSNCHSSLKPKLLKDGEDLPQSTLKCYKIDPVKSSEDGLGAVGKADVTSESYLVAIPACQAVESEGAQGPSTNGLVFFPEDPVSEELGGGRYFDGPTQESVVSDPDERRVLKVGSEGDVTCPTQPNGHQMTSLSSESYCSGARMKEGRKPNRYPDILYETQDNGRATTAERITDPTVCNAQSISQSFDVHLQSTQEFWPFNNYEPHHHKTHRFNELNDIQFHNQPETLSSIIDNMEDGLHPQNPSCIPNLDVLPWLTKEIASEMRKLVAALKAQEADLKEPVSDSLDFTDVDRSASPLLEEDGECPEGCSVDDEDAEYYVDSSDGLEETRTDKESREVDDKNKVTLLIQTLELAIAKVDKTLLDSGFACSDNLDDPCHDNSSDSGCKSDSDSLPTHQPVGPDSPTDAFSPYYCQSPINSSPDFSRSLYTIYEHFET